MEAEKSNRRKTDPRPVSDLPTRHDSSERHCGTYRLQYPVKTRQKSIERVLLYVTAHQSLMEIFCTSFKKRLSSQMYILSFQRCLLRKTLSYMHGYAAIGENTIPVRLLRWPCLK